MISMVLRIVDFMNRRVVGEIKIIDAFLPLRIFLRKILSYFDSAQHIACVLRKPGEKKCKTKSPLSKIQSGP